jgi:hypothetical protein
MTTTGRQVAIERALASATEAMHAKRQVQPRVIAHAGDKLLAFHLGDAMERPVKKDLAAEMMGSEMRKRGVQLYVFMSEAWMASGIGEKDLTKSPPPSQRPDRIECLILSASDGEGDILGLEGQ